MTTGALRGPVAACLLACAAAGAPDAADPDPFPTPELVHADVDVHQDDFTAIGATTPFPPGTTAHRVGIILVCTGDTLQARLSLGTIPADKPLQLAVVAPDGDVQRFGPVFSAGPRSGFHDPIVTDAGDLARLVPAVFRNGTLVSNGHISFWNRMSPALNDDFLDFARACQGT